MTVIPNEMERQQIPQAMKVMLHIFEKLSKTRHPEAHREPKESHMTDLGPPKTDSSDRYSTTINPAMKFNIEQFQPDKRETSRKLLVIAGGCNTSREENQYCLSEQASANHKKSARRISEIQLPET
ncbi:hypothetical protein ACTXT7_007875 [Hymenolepis weldensis]